MPYILQEKRSILEPFLNDVFGCFNENEFTLGDLNYIVTRIAQEYLVMHGKSYSTLNDITGALENCKLEFYRRISAPYEDQKAIMNGDVMPDFRGDKE